MPKKKRRRTGRPSTFRQAIADEICERLACGESLRRICASDKMPPQSTVFRWLASPTHTLFREQYMRAREAQADTMADEIVDIADDSANDYRVVDGDTLFNAEAVARARLRVDARKWVAAKLKPKVYGDKLHQEVTGKDGKDLVPPAAPVIALTPEQARKALLEVADKV